MNSSLGAFLNLVVRRLSLRRDMDIDMDINMDVDNDHDENEEIF